MIELFQYHFFLKALVSAVFASVICGIIGTYIVSRRIVFISGGISHASFGGVGLAYFSGFNPVLGAALFSVGTALTIQSLSDKLHIRKDTMIGIMWSLGMATGIIFIYFSPGYHADLMGFLFGNILTITLLDIYMLGGLTLVVSIFFTVFYKEILLISFDENYARSQGIPVSAFNYFLISLVAVSIVLNIRIVGIILIISLLTIPQATANLLTKSFRPMMFYAIGFALISTIWGLITSYYLDIPSGASIIFTSAVIFILVYLIKNVISRFLRESHRRQPAG